jgi:hypothetical protein
MPRSSFVLTRNKTSVALLVLALVIGGISAQATGLLNLTSGGYLVCVNPVTKVVTHPSTSKCPKNYEKLILGAQGDAGTVGITGAAGLPGVDGKNGIDGRNGSDGKTLWNGITDPASTWGAPGDMFINAATKVLFGPKDLTTGWPAGVPMLGLQGVKGDTGVQGATGAQGSTGATGSSGTAGSNGSNGAAGTNGNNATLTCTQGGTCIIGNTGPGGGIVFYVQTATAAAPWRYLEAAPNTWSGGVADPTITWCSNTSAFVAALTSGSSSSINTLQTIGAGYLNTKLMLGSCTYGAANIAASYNGGGKSDWFLPSKDERDALYLQQVTVGGFVAGNYWSSSEYTAGLAYFQIFGTGFQNANNKTNAFYVRPIRAF